jgi:hypothetical protein
MSVGYVQYVQERFEDTKGVIKNSNSMENKQNNDQKKKDKKMMIDRIQHRKLQIEQHEPC